MAQDDFNCPIAARKYCLSFGRRHKIPSLSYIETATRRIYFFDMTDEEAIDAANMLRRDIEIPAMANKAKVK